MDPTVESIQRAGLRCAVFDRVVEDPPEQILFDLKDFAKSNDG